MTLRSEIENSTLTVILDIRYPQAYLALHPVSAFGRRHGIDLNWLPLSASTLKPPSTPSTNDDRGIRHRRIRAEQVAREIEIYAEIQGLVLRDVYRSGESTAANLGWLWMRHHDPDHLEAYLFELFRAYWAVEFDPASEVETATLIEALGHEREPFLAWCRGDGPSLLEKLLEDLHAHGIFAAPGYLIEDEVFLGRQHLPMIDWILAGRNGQIPI